jgi:hypothetical protein
VIRASTRKRRSSRAAAAVIVAVAALVSVPLVAFPPSAAASTALPVNTPVITSAADTYTFGTTLMYWSAVAVQPTAGADFDLRLLDGSGSPVAGSYWGAGATDVIAINSTGGARPLGPYQAQVTHYSGTGQYDVMFWEKRVVFVLPTDPVGSTATALGLHYGWPVAAYMIYLLPGQSFRVYSDSSVRVFLAGSTPGVPSTYLRTRSDLAYAYVIADNVPSPGGGYCRVFQATAAGWYSLILIWNVPLQPPPYDGGLAVFPQRYNPAQGDTLSDCPAPGP